jgi:hypothetical protein
MVFSSQTTREQNSDCVSSLLAVPTVWTRTQQKSFWIALTAVHSAKFDRPATTQTIPFLLILGSEPVSEDNGADYDKDETPPTNHEMEGTSAQSRIARQNCKRACDQFKDPNCYPVFLHLAANRISSLWSFPRSSQRSTSIRELSFLI